MITAKEARKLAGVPDLEYVNDAVEKLCHTISALAKSGKRILRTGYDHHGDDDLWQTGGYSQTKEWKAAVEKLQKLGFEVRFHYEQRQFVDLYTEVKW